MGDTIYGTTDSSADGADGVGVVENFDAAPPVAQPSTKKSANDIKTAMQNERTFFKYLWSALHIGAVGTWLLKFYTEPTQRELYLVVFTWLVSFIVIIYGLYRFYNRRWAMQQGFKVEVADSPFAVIFMTACVTLSVGGVVIYVVATVP